MIPFFLKIIICAILVCGDHNGCANCNDLQDVKTSKNSTGVHLNDTEKNPNSNNSASQLKIINGKIYIIQTFKPKAMGLKKQELVISRTENILGPSCTTPNNDTGHCISSKECPVSNNVKSKETNKEFVEDSTCRRYGNEVRYCCGKYENFKYLLPKRPSPKSCGFEQVNLLKGRVFGGTPARLGEFPWSARIIHTSNEGDKSVGCEGFLIHKRFVSTAAHCVRSPRIVSVGNITEIQLGEHNTRTEKDCIGSKCADPLQTMRVKSIIPHPDYRHNSRDHHYDVALIYSKGEVKFSDYVQPICLSPEPNMTEAYWISGWGKTEKGSYSDVKLKVSVPPFDIVECNKLYTKVRVKVGQSQLCAGGEKGKDSCVGDSGGPLMQQSNDKRWFAVGLVSFGISCGLDGWPGVYTSIAYYYDWIVDEIIKLREPELLIKFKNHSRSESDFN